MKYGMHVLLRFWQDSSFSCAYLGADLYNWSSGKQQCCTEACRELLQDFIVILYRVFHVCFTACVNELK